MREIFVDTSAFYALSDHTDPAHAVAVAFYRGNKIPLVTTNLIFAETLSLLTKRLGKQVAISFGGGMRTSRILRIVNLPDEYEQETWDRFSRYTDKDFDYIDASSFVFMDRHEMDTAFTFDRHYLQMNYKVVPQRPCC